MDEKEVEPQMQQICSRTAEIVEMSELQTLLESGSPRSAYIGFEPSGLAHIGWMIMSAKINDLLDTDFKVTILLADWHAYINDKLSGDLDRIRTCGKFMEDSFTALGVEPSKVNYVYASQLIDSASYWEKVLRIAKKSTLSRVRKAMTIMGRKEDEADTDSSKFFYPAMQAADIFELDVDVAYGGMDQRKAHMLARDSAEKLGWRKPIAIHTPLISGLDVTGRMDIVDAKMSKSNPDSTIFLNDETKAIEKKLKKAYCPEGEVEGNPIVELCELILFPRFHELNVERPAKFGGDLTLTSPQHLKDVFERKELHPLDLKLTSARYLNRSLEPVREYFSKHSDNLEAVKGYTVTR